MDLKTIGNKLREGRERKGYSLRWVAEKVDLHHSYIGKLEKGVVKSPGVQTLEKLCNVYDIEVYDLFGKRERLPENVDIEWISLSEEFKKDGLTPEEIRKYVKIVKDLKQM